MVYIPIAVEYELIQSRVNTVTVRLVLVYGYSVLLLR